LRVCGLDVATTTGLALVERLPGARERLIRHGIIRVRDAGAVKAAAEHIAADQPDLVALEVPFFGPATPGAALPLAEIVGRFKQELERRGLETVTAPAVVWQAGMLKGLINGRSDRAARKRAAQLWAQRQFAAELKERGVSLSEDEADAAVLAVWALRLHAMRRAA
jgi:hypothetical protein